MLIFFNKVLTVEYSEALRNIYDVLPIISHFGLSIGIIYVCVHINRLIAKEVVQRYYFKDELHMPTTENLLWKNSYYEKETKIKIRKKIQQKYGLALLNEQEEKAEELRARRLIMTAVGQIRKSLEGNPLLFQHNWEYGLWRNLIGGSILAILFSIALIVFGSFNHNISLRATGTICLVLYFLPVIFSKIIMDRFGNYYSRICYQQFLSL
jgi:hypothetical protein